jgi:hypothetical protein
MRGRCVKRLLNWLRVQGERNESLPVTASRRVTAKQTTYMHSNWATSAISANYAKGGETASNLRSFATESFWRAHDSVKKRRS